MPTAPTLVAFTQAEASTANGATLATGSVSWQTNDVVVVLAGTEGVAAGETAWSLPTSTGSGLTFSQQQAHSSTGSDGGAAGWTAVASASSSGTISVTCPRNPSGSENLIVGAYVFRGSDGVGNSAISTGSARTVALTLTGADGAVAWIVVDWAAAAVQSFTPTATTHGSGSPGPTASPFTQLIGGTITFYIGELDDQTSAGSVNYGIGGSGTGPFTIIAIEAKAGAAGGGGTTSGPVLTPGMVSRPSMLLARSGRLGAARSR